MATGSENPVWHIHLWKSSAKTSFGHISLQVDDVYISHWPQTCKNDILSAIVGCPVKWYDTFEEEIGEIGYPTLTYHIVDMNVEALRDWWTKFKSEQQDWSLLRNSCSNIVHKALAVGSDWFEGSIEGFATSPEAVANLVESYNNNRKAKIVCVGLVRERKNKDSKAGKK